MVPFLNMLFNNCNCNNGYFNMMNPTMYNNGYTQMMPDSIFTASAIGNIYAGGTSQIQFPNCFPTGNFPINFNEFGMTNNNLQIQNGIYPDYVNTMLSQMTNYNTNQLNTLYNQMSQMTPISQTNSFVGETKTGTTNTEATQEQFNNFQSNEIKNAKEKIKKENYKDAMIDLAGIALNADKYELKTSDNFKNLFFNKENVENYLSELDNEYAEISEGDKKIIDLLSKNKETKKIIDKKFPEIEETKEKNDEKEKLEKKIKSVNTTDIERAKAQRKLDELNEEELDIDESDDLNGKIKCNSKNAKQFYSDYKKYVYNKDNTKMRRSYIALLKEEITTNISPNGKSWIEIDREIRNEVPLIDQMFKDLEIE